MRQPGNALNDSFSSEDAFFADLYQRQAPALIAYAYRLLSSREDAEDIVFDVFVQVLQNPRFATFDAKAQKTLLWTMTRNKAVDIYRRHARHRQISLDWLNEPLYEDLSQAPEQLSLRREEYTQLYHAIQTLPKSHQEVLRLRFGHGLKCNQIAPLLEKNEEAVRGLLYRSLQKLRALYHNKQKKEEENGKGR